MRLHRDPPEVTRDRPPEADDPSAISSRLVPRVILAVLVLVYATLGAYWLNAGHLPGFDTGPKVSDAMPVRAGPEPAQSALLKPPAAAPAPAAPPPQPAAPQAAKPPAPPPAQAPAPAPAPAPAQALPAVPDEPGIPASPSSGGAAPSLAALPALPPARPLEPVPLPELVKKSPNGDLPVIGPGNRQSWRAYARPFRDDSGRPRVAVLVTGLGLSKGSTETAIAKLPAEVSLAFSPYARDLQQWIKRARQAGHEVLIELPVEPPQFPARDPGPLGLLAALSPEQVTTRLEKVMGRAMGYVGLAGMPGSPFAASPHMAAALAAMKQRGVLYAGDPATAAAHGDRLPAFVPIAQVLAEQPFRDAIDARLGQVIGTARSDGAALVVTEPLPVALERLAHWLAALPQNGVTLAPVSAIAQPPSPGATP